MGGLASVASPCTQLSLAEHAGQATECAWWAAVALGGRIYVPPCNSDRFLIIDPASGEVEALDTQRYARGNGKWRAAASTGSKVICVPDHAGQVLVYDIAARKLSGVETHSIARCEGIKWHCALTLSGKVYGIPYQADKLLIVDASTNKVSGVDCSTVARGGAKWLGGAVCNGRVYGLPCHAQKLLVYEPATKKVRGVDISSVASGYYKWLSLVVVGGKLYGIPCQADCILVFDTTTEEVSSVSTETLTTGPGKWFGAVVIQRRIYAVPDHAPCILVFDTVTGLLSGIDVSGIASGPHKWQGGAALDGVLYAAPHDASVVLRYNPVGGEVEGLPVGDEAEETGKWGPTLVVGRTILGIPSASKRLLVYHPPIVAEHSKSPAVDLPKDLPEGLLEDFVAGWLSNWIYEVEDSIAPPPVPALSRGGDRCEFTILRVHENCMEGSLARFALVIASLPPGRANGEAARKVFYLVFKGTSTLLDSVLDSSLCPDFAAMDQAFGDKSSFVHHGAYNTIVQMKIHQWPIIIENARLASEVGAECGIVAGHSLGGQFAALFLFEMFLLHSRGTDLDVVPALLQNARCVSFGSPMCFGSTEGTEVRRDLAVFMRERSVNYIHRGDPSPRLWSELDIPAFVRHFAEHVLREQIPYCLRSLVDRAAGPGGLQQRAEEFLERRDVESQVLKPSARYVHLSAIRYLGDEHVCWRPFDLSRMVLADHALEAGYLLALRDAFSPAESCQLFSEEGQQIRVG